MEDEKPTTSPAGRLSEAEGRELVAIARRSLESYVLRHERYLPELADLPPALQVPAPSFVTLTANAELRGCIGSVVARLPLALDVAHNAVAAATTDPRFMPVQPEELAAIRLEVTVLTVPKVLPYRNYDELVAQLRPHVDGVMLTWLGARGLLLPQVWQKLPDPHVFLEHVCLKAGILPAELRRQPPEVTAWPFQIQAFHEPGYQEPG